MLEGNLNNVEVETKATVLTYKVPPTYGGYAEVFPNKVSKTEIDIAVDLSAAYALKNKFGSRIRVYPGSMELRNNETYALKSRVVGVLGIGEDIEEARQVSLEGLKAIKGGALWYRNDVASKNTIEKSIRHIQQLRA